MKYHTCNRHHLDMKTYLSIRRVGTSRRFNRGARGTGHIIALVNFVIQITDRAASARAGWKRKQVDVLKTSIASVVCAVFVAGQVFYLERFRARGSGQEHANPARAFDRATHSANTSIKGCGLEANKTHIVTQGIFIDASTFQWTLAGGCITTKRRRCGWKPRLNDLCGRGRFQNTYSLFHFRYLTV